MVKIKLNTVTRECIVDSNFLGFEGENQANVLDFSFSDKFVDGTAVLNIKRGKDIGFVSVDKVGNGYQLPVKSSLLSQVGDVTFQFVITTVDGAIMKFDPFVMTVEDAIDTDVPLPEEYPSWVEMANVKLAEIDIAIETANKTANQLLTDKANGVFNGKDGVDGKNAVSPTVKTEQTTTGAKITITDVNGTHIAEVLNGKDGKDGADGTMSFEELTEAQKASLKGDTGKAGADGRDGNDGYSPIAKVSQTSTGATITITDKTGTTTATVVNGVDGKDGQAGKDGANGSDGKDGNDGLTPFIGSNGNWWIGDTDTGVKASGEGGTGGGSSYKEVDLIDSPVEYNMGTSTTTIGRDLVFNEGVTNYDEIVFVVDIYHKGQAGYTHRTHIPVLVSGIIYADSDGAVFNGSPFYLSSIYGVGVNTNYNVAGLNAFTAGVHFKNETTLRIRNTAGSMADYTKFRIAAVKGIKYQEVQHGI